jgi:translation elongation factor EF-Ts
MPNETQSDHDIIITLVSSVKNLDSKFTDKFQDLKNDIKEIRDGTLNRLDNLEKEKANRQELTDIQNKINSLQKHVNENIEIRVNKLEKSEIANKVRMYIYIGIGTFIVGLLTYHIMGN